MAKDYVRKSGRSAKIRNNVATPQSRKARKGQVKNDAGGYVFKVGDMTYLNRFLILGTESPTYYVSAEKLSRVAAKRVEKLMDSSMATKAIDEIVRVSNEGLSPKNDPAIFALALAVNSPRSEVRKYALSKLSDVCRIFTHLATFLTYYQSMRKASGWGRGMRTAIANWYNQKKANNVAYQMCKYPSRRVEGETPWTHRDVLRKAHVIPFTPEHDTAFRYAVKGVAGFENGLDNLINTDLSYIYAHEAVKEAKSVTELINLIHDHSITFESVPTEFHKSKQVWKALLEHMPMTATIRNLARLTSLDILAPLASENSLVIDRILNEDALRKSRMHPINLLIAWRIYSRGYGLKGNLKWTPVPDICSALEDAFYLSFKTIEPTNKRILVGIDMSGSMGGSVYSGNDKNGDDTSASVLNTVEVAAAMSMSVLRSEKSCHLIGFDTVAYDNLGISKSDRLETVMRKIRPRGGTDCSIPVRWANSKHIDVDAFVIFTDNQSWYGTQHPYQALEKYRKDINSEAKLVNVAMTADRISIADQDDFKGSLDVSGFNAQVPLLTRNFILGNF